MEYYFITGVSRGLGKALALTLLEESNTKVFGYSRSNPEINDENFEWYFADFSNNDEILNFEFPEINFSENDKIILINNAAIIGDINFTGNKNNQKIIDTYTVNIIAPAVLTNKFMNKFCNTSAQKIIMNISSGAGRHPIVSWADYCATKAAMDMLSQTIKEEIDFGSCTNTKIFSVAPGIVDTKMQEDIRNSGPDRFPYHKTFVEYKENNLLWSPEKVSGLLLQIIKNTENSDNVLLDVREL
jgi:benzil reductase ((S)-benzoin forming)